MPSPTRIFGEIQDVSDCSNVPYAGDTKRQGRKSIPSMVTTMQSRTLQEKLTMMTTKFPVFGRSLRGLSAVMLLCLAGLMNPVRADDKDEGKSEEGSGQAKISSSIGADGTEVIVIEARGHLPEPPVYFTAKSDADVTVGDEDVDQVVQLAINVIQGAAKTLSLGIYGDGRVTKVEGTDLKSWSVRQAADQRFLDLHLGDGVTETNVVVTLQSAPIDLDRPTTILLTHLAPGEAVGFDSKVMVHYGSKVEGKVMDVTGFVSLESSDGAIGFQSSTGGQIKIELNHSGSSPPAIELVDTVLEGEAHANGQSMEFKFRGTAVVTTDDAAITILSGNAAVSDFPSDANYRVRLATEDGHPVYKLVFSEAGRYPVALDFVAALARSDAGGREMDFTVAAGAVVPLTLDGLEPDLDFRRGQDWVVPVRIDQSWQGFLPAGGRAHLQWKAARTAGTGKLFFTTTGLVEAKVGAGLLRQEHQIDVQVLQGELKSLAMLLSGPGEILDVQGQNIVAWEVDDSGSDRRLQITLSQPMKGASSIQIRSQTPLGAFPVRVEGMRLSPIDAIRYSGFLRLSNLGSVRFEPTGLSGLAQLSPDQFPGDPTDARQVFVYRFPAAEHGFTIAADRIQPEVNVSELIRYQLAEADRMIHADVELDIREAPIREWDFGIPADYSVVAVTGASVADYVAASTVVEGRRNLKVMFGNDVSGRQLVMLHLEKSETATAGQWALPRIVYPDAKTVRGNIGIVGAPGFRIAIEESQMLVEKPLSYFPKPTPGLQQAFRIREPDWSATMRIEVLERSIQSDVFHLYSLNQRTVYGSALINYFVTGAPVSQWRVAVPESFGNVMVDGQGVRTWRRDGDTLIVSLHQPVMGASTLLVTFEEKPDQKEGSFQAGQITPLDVNGERGYIQIVSPVQVEINSDSVSPNLLKLDPLELPAEFRLLSDAPPLGTWQYTDRPFELGLRVNWFEPGTMVTQVVEFSEANSRVSQDGELVTDVLYFVKSRGRRTFKIQLPDAPVRLWEVSVNDQVVTARQADGATFIPLPGGTDPNVPIEVRLRLGKPAVDADNPKLALPIVDAPVLKTLWKITGNEKHLLVPTGGTVAPAVPVTRLSGFGWVAKNGMVSLFLIGLFSIIGIWTCNQSAAWRLLGLISFVVAISVSVAAAGRASLSSGSLVPLRLSLPVLSAGDTVEMQVQNTPLWLVDISWTGWLLCLLGIVAIAAAMLDRTQAGRTFALRFLGMFMIAIGVLMQGGGAPWFYGIVAVAILILLFVRPAMETLRAGKRWLGQIKQRSSANRGADRPAAATGADATGADATGADATGADATGSDTTGAGGSVTATLLLAVAFALTGSTLSAAVPDGMQAADSITQQWTLTQLDQRLRGEGTVVVSGRPGDRFLLLRAPAVLTGFQGAGLRLTKTKVDGDALGYVVSIPISDDQPAQDDDSPAAKMDSYQATFQYQLESIQVSDGVSVLTGSATVQQIQVHYDQPGWDILCPAAVRVMPIPTDDDTTRAELLLGLDDANVQLKPKARDVTTEQTRFFVEASTVYLPSPGVVDGRHRLHVRPSQGQVSTLMVTVPAGVTVSAVDGPIGGWQFDAKNGQLMLEIEPAMSKPFDVIIDTQRGLDPIPTDVELSPLRVVDAGGEVGLVAIAFGADAQPEQLESQGMSAVNIGDFDASLVPNKQAVLHRVYRYGATTGTLSLRVTPVQSEVRVISQQVLSLGDERLVLAVNFAAEISRAGLFQLSFPLPEGLEVETLSGAALHHWAELSEDGKRIIILHLNGKTMGAQNFSMTLSGTSPTDAGDWQVPHFEMREATRQTGEMIVRPTTGIRLRTVTRQNVSETDPRAVGGQGQGTLAFRLLQRDWNLVLGIEKLDPWITAEVLHDVTLREGQTRSMLLVSAQVQNASIRSLQVVLPITDPDEIKTLRASGDTVSDLVRTAPDSNVWEVQFKRRVIGNIQFRIEYERRGDRQQGVEVISAAEFPQTRQLSYYVCVRAGGRLELTHGALPSGWQRTDWNTIPQPLRDAGNRNSPSLAMRAMTPVDPLRVTVQRHSLADALKLRVTQGSLTTVLSPTGNQLTAVDVHVEVIQRSSLTVGLPPNGELFNIFVNGESVNSIRTDDSGNTWQFYILPGIDDRTATVRFVYSVTGDRLRKMTLTSPELNVPLENIRWNVVAPEGFEMVDNDGNLELIRQSNQNSYDRKSYLSIVSGKRQVQAQQANELLQQANELLQAGEQSKARRALSSVANRYALDAASNEDARVQLQSLQTQQAIVGLNTRRQRLYLDNKPNDGATMDHQQLRDAAATNPILQQDNLNFRPQQLSELLRGNTTEDNAVLQQIAGRLVQHQHTTDPAPQAILISLPEEGVVYTFSRTVQVAENSALQLDLDFDHQRRIPWWQTAWVLILLFALMTVFAFATTANRDIKRDAR
ncbi:hypothetical protein K227x_00390 [Rubripirellula lacrimiformis]|uniref:Uncharacterized protein n=1 Tax=Rubripirellula lacrimiformis TaxID=1930273 RepID=A0A517N3F7_9BACT|nr:hypothetical protein [Rubripirellula lacrimiformis]QDT01672.1 hypothetical protein K227x_00390 [Rubripirellula lacrimiformis]